MAHYRKIDVRIWNDQKFDRLSMEARFMFMFLLTHPNLNVLGSMRASKWALMDELRYTSDQVTYALEELHQNDMIRFDITDRLIWIPNFLKYNPPTSPNVVKSWEKVIDYLPECNLRDTLASQSVAYLKRMPETFQKALGNSLRPYREEKENNISVDAVPESVKITENVEAVTASENIPQAIEVCTEEEATDIEESLSLQLPSLQTSSSEMTLLSAIDTHAQENTTLPQDKIIEFSSASLDQRTSSLRIFSYWQKTFGHPQAKLDEKRRRIIRRALSAGYSEKQLCDAIKGCSLTPHNAGLNDQGQRYDGLHIIFKDADQIDRFIRNSYHPPQLRNAADHLLASNIMAGQRWLAQTEREVCNGYS